MSGFEYQGETYYTVPMVSKMFGYAHSYCNSLYKPIYKGILKEDVDYLKVSDDQVVKDINEQYGKKIIKKTRWGFAYLYTKRGVRRLSERYGKKVVDVVGVKIEVKHKEVSEITIKEYKGQRVVTFKDIDEVHGRPEGTASRNFNKHKIKFINKEDYFHVSFEELRSTNFVERPNPQGLTLLTESGYLMLVKSFTDDLAWQVQRSLVKSYFRAKQMQVNENKLPTSFAEALRLAADLSEEKQKLQTENLMLEQRIAESEPKITYYDTILKSTKLLTVTAIAKDYGLTAQELNNILHDEGIQFKQGKQWFLYKQYADKGYTKSETFIDPTGESRLNTKWTQKGRLFIHGILTRLGYDPDKK